MVSKARIRYVTIMVLTNAERQARYRERLKQLAARGVMSPAQAEMLADIRRRLREWRRSISAFESGQMWLRTNGVDQSASHLDMLKGMIATNERLLDEYDPDNLTTDGNVELGALSAHESAQVLPGAWVSYRLDDDRLARDLRFYGLESHARTDALQAGRAFGVIAQDMWSIEPSPLAPAHAQIQQMPNGWWKGIVPEWGDLPEQVEMSRDRLVAVLGAVARDYLRERRARGVAVATPLARSVAGWTCVSLAIGEEQ